MKNKRIKIEHEQPIDDTCSKCEYGSYRMISDKPYDPIMCTNKLSFYYNQKLRMIHTCKLQKEKQNA